MSSVYLEKRESLRKWLTPTRVGIVTALALAIFFIPIHHKSVQARFILEPAQRAVVRSAVPGIVSAVHVAEGQKVNLGYPLVQLRNVDLEARSSKVQRDLQLADATVTDAGLRYSAQGAALTDLQHRRLENHIIQQQLAGLELRSPIAGTVITPIPENLVGSRIEAGQATVEIADLSSIRARLYVAESDMHDVALGETVRLRLDSSFRSFPGTVDEIEPAASEIQPGLQPKPAYKGLTPPGYYMILVRKSDADGPLVNGATGTAKIYLERQSLAGWVWQAGRDFFRRKVW